jgi:hypothetical protein
MRPHEPRPLTRQARLDTVLTLVRSWGWEPDPTFTPLGGGAVRWWLPHTTWRLRCTTQDCTVYRVRRRAGATQNRTIPLAALGTIREALARIHKSVTTEEVTG